jgi:hypothetical protein
MTNKGRILCTLAFLLMASAMSARPASASACTINNISGSSTIVDGCITTTLLGQDVDGNFEYSFRLDNLTGGLDGLAFFDLELTLAKGGLNQGGPATRETAAGSQTAGWEHDSFPIQTLLGWHNLQFLPDGSPDTAFDLKPGESMLGFTFSALDAVTDIPSWDFQIAAYDAPVQEPNPVPEPSTLLLLGSGLAGAWKMRRARQRTT